MKKNRTLIILAGGQSRRMGENKAFLKVGSETFIESLLKKFEVYGERIIVANDPLLYQFTGVRTVKDIYPDMGPVCGLYTGINESSHEKCVVLTVDTPFISVELMEHLSSMGDEVDAVIPVINGRHHPLCAIYNKSAAKTLKNALEKDERKVRKVLEALTVKNVSEIELNQFGDVEKLFQNINTPEEYKEAMKR